MQQDDKDYKPVGISELQSGRQGSGALAPKRTARSVSLTRRTITPHSRAPVATASEPAIVDATPAEQDGVRSKQSHSACRPGRDRAESPTPSRSPQRGRLASRPSSPDAVADMFAEDADSDQPQ